MIIERVRVQNWRCIVSPIEIKTFATDRVNVVFAPNASGKSSFFEALRFGLTLPHKINTQRFREIQSWGRQTAPFVSIDFSHSGSRYRLEKRFLSNPFSRLSIEQNGKWTLLAEDDQATERVMSFLRGSVKAGTRATSQIDHWGIAQALWAPQNQLALTALSGDLVELISGSVNVQSSDPLSAPIEALIESLYQEYFTDQKGNDKKGSPFLIAADRLAAATARVETCESARRRYDDAARSADDARAEYESLKRIEADAQTTLQLLQADAKKVRALLEAKEKRQHERDVAKLKFDTAQRREQELLKARTDCNDVRDALKALSAKMSALVEQDALSRQALDDATTALDAHRATASSIDALGQAAARAQKFQRALESSGSLTRRLKTISDAEAERDAAQTSYSAIPVAPDDSDLKKIRKSDTLLRQLTAQIASSMISIEIRPSQDGELTIASAESPAPGKVSLKNGETIVIRGSAPQIDLPGVGSLRASGPLGSLDDLRKTFDAETARYKKLVSPFPTDNADELEALSMQASSARSQLAAAAKRLEDILDGDDPASLRKTLATSNAERDALLAAYPDWSVSPPDPDALEAEYHSLKRAFDARNTELSEAAKSRAIKSEETARLRATADGQLSELTTRLSAAKSALSVLESSFLSGEEIKNTLLDQTMKSSAAEEKLKEIEKELSLVVGDPISESERMAIKLEQIRNDAVEKTKAESAANALLDSIAQSDAYRGNAEATASLEQARAEYARESARKAAVKRLRDIVQSCRAARQSALSAPVRESAIDAFRRIAGSHSISDIVINDSLTPSSIIPAAVAGVVSNAATLDNASGGESEQIHLAVRLALADLIVKTTGERQTVVLDDILPFTDPARMNRVIGIIEERVSQLQIIILTCDPSRYRGLRTAEFIDFKASVLNDLA